MKWNWMDGKGKVVGFLGRKPFRLSHSTFPSEGQNRLFSSLMSSRKELDGQKKEMKVELLGC
jgi:hypothetical protein